MKKHLMYAILTTLLCLAMVFGLAACGGENETTAADDGTTTAAPDGDDSSAPDGDGSSTPDEDDSSAPDEDDSSAPAEDDSSAPAEDGSSAPDGDDSSAPAGDGSSTSTEDGSSAPDGDGSSTPAEDNSSAPAGDNSSAPAGDGSSAPDADETQPPHNHIYAEEWSFNETHHWHVAICEHSDEKLNYAEHAWDEGTVTAPATCGNAGTLTYTCACGATKTEEIPQLAHSYAEEWSNDETHHWHAATCEHSDAKTDYAEHIWDEGTVTIPATCGNVGTLTYTCICGVTKAEEISQIEHTYTTEWSKDETHHWHVATCEHSDETADYSEHTCDINRICTVCGYQVPTEGLQYALNSDGQSYRVAGIGTVTDTTVVIPTTYQGLPVTSIGEKAFLNCTSFTSITIPDSVTSIGYSAFSGCASLASTTIPDSVTSIGIAAFSSCTSLTSITIPFVGATKDGTSNTHFGYIFGSYSHSSNSSSVPPSLQTVVITGGESIGVSAFNGCSSLTSIMIPDSLIGIGNLAFYNCTSLTSITIPDGVVSIGVDAFYGCTNLIQTEGGVSYVDKWVIDCDTSVTNVELRSNTIGIGDRSFYGCNGLTSITIPNGVTSIGQWAFRDCKKLANITTPDSLTNIGAWAFAACENFTSIVIPNSVTTIGEDAFHGSGNIKSVYISDISAWCNIAFGNSYSNPLYYAHNLYLNDVLVTELVIPDGVTSIGSSAFYACTNLTSVTIPDEVTSIGDYAFDDCPKLTSVTIPYSVTSIGFDAFRYCTSLTSVHISDFAAWCNIAFENHYSNPLRYAHNLYLNDVLVTDPVVPDGVTSIGDYAFYNCTTLTSITIPDSVTSIGGSAFYGCTSLTSITIPDSVTSIGLYAFYNCSWLTSITIPDSVTTIVSSAFYGCTRLKTVYYTGTAEEWGEMDLASYNNDYLTSATRYYYSETAPTDTENLYWHYVEGVPTAW